MLDIHVFKQKVQFYLKIACGFKQQKLENKITQKLILKTKENNRSLLMLHLIESLKMLSTIYLNKNNLSFCIQIKMARGTELK